MLIDLVSKSRIANLIQADEVIQAVGPTIRHKHAMKCNGESAFAKCLDRLRFTENTGSRRNHDLLPAV